MGNTVPRTMAYLTELPIQTMVTMGSMATRTMAMASTATQTMDMASTATQTMDMASTGSTVDGCVVGLPLEEHNLFSMTHLHIATQD